MKKKLQISILFIIGIFILSPFSSKAQIANPVADAVYNGWKDAYLITSGDGNKTPYFCQTLANRERAFFWQQAYLIWAVEDAYDRSPSEERKQLVSDLLNKLIIQDLKIWTWDSWNDDLQWAMIACMRGYQITGNTLFRDVAVDNWYRVWNRGWDSTFGGGIWEDNAQIPNGGKCGLSNWPQIIPGCMMVEALADSDPVRSTDILNKCKQIYAWGRTHLWDPNTGRVYEGHYPDPSRNFSGDDNSYNYGLLTNSAASLYKITKDRMYYDDAIRVADRNIAKINAQSGGIMTEDKFWNGGFGGEQLARGLAKLANENYLWDKYYPFLKANADAAWSHRRTDHNFTQNNFSMPTPTSGYDFMAMELTGSVVIQQVTPVVQPLLGTIQASNYNFMKGVEAEASSEGGSNLKNIQTGDWIDYIMNVPTSNYYTITYRIASESAGSVSLLQNGEILSVTALPNTGGLQTWADANTTVYLKKGIQSIRLAATTGGWNISKWSVKSCQTIVPYVSVNGAADLASAYVTLNPGDNLALKPQSANGDWSWTGPDGFTANTREVNFTNIQQVQGGVYTVTYKCPEGSYATQDFMLTINGCTPGTVETLVKINDGSLTPQTDIQLLVGDTVLFSPKPLNGVWKWTGPNGFEATTREITLSKITNAQTGNYTLTYYNENGCKSTQIFTVHVSGDDFCGTAIRPYLTVNNNGWQQVDNVMVNIGDNVSVGPQPTNGTWSWTGPNGFTSSGREFTITNFTAQKAGLYIAEYKDPAGCVKHKEIIIGAKNCQPLSIMPVIQVNGVSKTASGSITVLSGDDIIITPPAANGIWRWTGPDGFTSNATQITISKILIKHAGDYSVSYFDSNGCKSTYAIKINVAGQDYCSTPIVPHLQVNSGSWNSTSNASVASGDKLTFGPQPTTIGTWQWTGPNGFTATTREVTLNAITKSLAGIYKASYTTLSGCKSFLDFSLTVDGFSGNPNLNVSEVEQLKVNLYPNPNNGIFNIELQNEQYQSLSIFTLSGTLVYTKKINNETELKINLNGVLKSGVYLVFLESNNKKVTKKLIVK
jgi:predicted alpha-1,6-mannanase (GH76 family)